MGHFVFGGILEKYPNLKIVGHHGGGMIPYYEQRIVQHAAKIEMVNLTGYMEGDYMQGLTKTPIQYFKMFYADTAIHGNTPALMCAHKFFGPHHIIFGADMPLGDRNFGVRSYRQTINAIEDMDITPAERKAIFEDNARDLMRLPV
jgi:aminocarboxymuconate-semialdehyde decarboxylase